MKSLNFFIFASYVLSSLATYADDQNVVATFGDEKITLGEFYKRYDDVQKQASNVPSKEVFLEDLIRYKIGLKEAQRKNIKDDPVVAERINQEIYKGLIEKELGKSIEEIKISESEMKSHYSKFPEIRSSHILIELKPAASVAEKAAAKKRMESIYSEVKASKRSFEELVSLYSDDATSKAYGGDIGWHTKLTLTPSFFRAIEKLKPGQLTGIVETDFGFHIVKVTDRNSYEKANKRQIRIAVFEEKRKSIFNKYFDRLKSTYKIKVNPSILKN